MGSTPVISKLESVPDSIFSYVRLWLWNFLLQAQQVNTKHKGMIISGTKEMILQTFWTSQRRSSQQHPSALGIWNGWSSTMLPPTGTTSFPPAGTTSLTALICLTSHCRHVLSNTQKRTQCWEDAKQNNLQCANVHRKQYFRAFLETVKV